MPSSTHGRTENLKPVFRSLHPPQYNNLRITVNTDTTPQVNLPYKHHLKRAESHHITRKPASCHHATTYRSKLTHPNTLPTTKNKPHNNPHH